MKPIAHALAGAAAMLIIASFWCSTLIAEAFLDHAAVASVKQAIVYGLFLLAPAMAAVGGSGFALAGIRKTPLLERKKMRMRIIGANGLIVMVPAALFLNIKAAAGDFDIVFYSIQAVELLVGAVQLSLMGMNFRDGLRLAGKAVASSSERKDRAASGDRALLDRPGPRKNA
jgi:hypothetical protein